MPLTTLHLIALSPGRSISLFLRALRTQLVQPLVAAKVIRWIIRPEKLSTHLTRQEWDLLVILPASTTIPDAYIGDDWVRRHWSITAGVPKALVDGFATRNAALLRDAGPPPTGSLDRPRMAESTQGLELDEEMLRWSEKEGAPTGAVSMLNLLSFKPGKEAHESYLRYGKAFAESIGKRRGGNAKVVGRVVRDQKTDGEDRYGWDEIALAHYPSIKHFVDMLGSEDYQKVNHENRLPALLDTCILCTSELDPEVIGDKARL